MGRKGVKEMSKANPIPSLVREGTSKYEITDTEMWGDTLQRGLRVTGGGCPGGQHGLCKGPVVREHLAFQGLEEAQRGTSWILLQRPGGYMH